MLRPSNWTVFTAFIFWCLMLACAKAEPLAAGRGEFTVGQGPTSIRVLTYKPKDYTDGPLLIVLHGKKRNVEGYRNDAITLADRRKLLIAAPYFDEARFPREDYQQGGVIKKGIVQPRESWTYQRVLEVIESVRQRQGRADLPYYLIGHSAGAQFAMRFAALMPAGARRIVAANPGSDLFPRRDWPFGYGFGALGPDLGDDAAIQRYLAAPLTLYLGQADTDPNHPELDRSAAAMRQGNCRLERGRNCFDYAQKLAQEHRWAFNWQKVEVANIAHDGKAMLNAKEVDEALFGGNDHANPAASAIRSN